MDERTTDVPFLLYILYVHNTWIFYIKSESGAELDKNISLMLVTIIV